MAGSAGEAFERPSSSTRGILTIQGGVPPAEEVLRDYLSAYARRRDRRLDGLVFGDPRQDALAGLLYARTGLRLEEPRARAAAASEVRSLTYAAGGPGGGSRSASIAGFARLLAHDLTRSPWGLGAETSHALFRGRPTPGRRSLASLAWRAVFLARVKTCLSGAYSDVAKEELDRRIEAITGALNSRPLKARRSTTLLEELFVLALLGQETERHHLCEAVRSALCPAMCGLGKDLTDRAQEIALLALIGGAVGQPDALALAGSLLALPREKTGLFQTSSGRLVLSAWIPLALLESTSDLATVRPVLDPPAPPPSVTRLEAARCGRGKLAYTVLEDGERSQRVLTEEDLNLLLDRALSFYEGDAADRLSPRQHAHTVLALLRLASRCTDDVTRQSVERQLECSVEALLARQEPNGGWPFAHKTVNSVVYSAGGASKTAFPDLQYTIDAAVPGIALCLAHESRRDPRLLDAAHKAFAFYEDVIGRVLWRGRWIWRLYPEDSKTYWMGTAVNYELWSSYFFAALARVTPHPRIRARAHGYVADSIAYSSSHVTTSGDVAYGDYTPELRTAYACWDAWLLAEIHSLDGSRLARDISRRIVHRLEQVMLPSGALPNVTDDREDFAGFVRWRVHRHGIGPHPIRSYYQLYYLIASARASVCAAAGLRALGYVLLELYEETFGTMSPGTAGDGSRGPATSSIPARDWVLFALSVLADDRELSYAPNRAKVRPVHSRLDARLHRLFDATLRGFDKSLVDKADPEAKTVRARLAIGCRALGWADESGTWLASAQAVVDQPRPVVRLLDELSACSSAPRLEELRSTLESAPEEDRRGAAYRLLELTEAQQRAGEDVTVQLETLSQLSQLAAATGQLEVLDRAGRRLGSLVGGQDSHGRWATNEDDLPRAVTALANATAAVPSLEAPIRAAVQRVCREAWRTLFDRRGRGFATAARDEPMGVARLAQYALAFTLAATRLHLAEHEAHGRLVIQQLLAGYNRPGGGLTRLPGQAVAKAPEAASAFCSLALTMSARPSWLL